MGILARAYSSARVSDSAQKCGGVHRKMIRNKMNGSSAIPPVEAAQPTTGGSAPAAPPMTIFCGVFDIKRKSEDGHGAAGKDKSKYKRLGTGDLPTRNGASGGAGHHSVDVS